MCFLDTLHFHYSDAWIKHLIISFHVHILQRENLGFCIVQIWGVFQLDHVRSSIRHTSFHPAASKIALPPRPVAALIIGAHRTSHKESLFFKVSKGRWRHEHRYPCQEMLPCWRQAVRVCVKSFNCRRDIQKGFQKRHFTSRQNRQCLWFDVPFGCPKGPCF